MSYGPRTLRTLITLRLSEEDYARLQRENVDHRLGIIMAHQRLRQTGYVGDYSGYVPEGVPLDPGPAPGDKGYYDEWTGPALAQVPENSRPK